MTLPGRIGVTLVFVLLAVALAGCGSTTTTESAAPCAVEIEFERSATGKQIAAFRGRVEAIPQVAHVSILSRERNVERFLDQLHRAGYSGDEFEALAARARSRAGALLVATPRGAAAVPAVLRALEELPASVTSVVDRDSCSTD